MPPKARSADDVVDSVRAWLDKHKHNNTDDHPLRFTVTPLGKDIRVSLSAMQRTQGGAIPRVVERFGGRKLSDGDWKYVQQKVTDMMLAENIYPSPEVHALTKEYVERYVNAELLRLDRDFPGEFKKHSDHGVALSGIFLLSASYPNEQKTQQNGQILIKLRPYSDVKDCRENYVKEPVITDMLCSSSETKDVEQAQRWVEEALQKKGFVSFDLDNVPDKKRYKQIPVGWIKKDTIRIAPHAQSANHMAVIVDANRKDRLPKITWSTGTDDRALAEERVKALVERFIPLYEAGGERAGQQFSTEDISEWMDKELPLPKKPKAHVQKRHNLMELCDGAGNPYLKIRTPGISSSLSVGGHQTYAAVLDFTTPREAYQCISIKCQLGTSDRALAEDRAFQAQFLAAQALDRWSKTFPGVEIITEDLPGKGTRLTKAGPGDVAPQGKVYFETLVDDAVKPVLKEFNRLIAWEVKEEKLPPEHDGDGKVQMTIRAIRNNDEPLSAEYSGPFTVQAPSQAAAKAFETSLRNAIFSQQFPDELFSRERPVIQFGNPSQGIVVRESLAAALRDNPAIEVHDPSLKKLRSGNPATEVNAGLEFTNGRSAIHPRFARPPH